MIRTILVDDERPALKAMEYLLSSYPEIEIVGAFIDIDQALAAIESNDIHLVFLDIEMPKLNGIAAARKIFAQQPEIEIVFVTAYNHFAVEAFEVNACDYIMKPVSPQRLNQTMSRIAQKRFTLKPLAMQQEKSEFLNRLLDNSLVDPKEIAQQATVLGIDFNHSFSFFHILLSAAKRQNINTTAEQSFMDELQKRPGLLAWQTEQGIGILDYSLAASPNCKNEELAIASHLKTMAAVHFPDLPVAVGIAERQSNAEKFAERYLQARNAAAIGLRISPDIGVYHFSDSGFLPFLNQYINEQSIDLLIDSTIGKLFEHDRITGSDLFHTMEMILLKTNLQDVAHALFIHYKTVISRKQSIEKILGFSINAFTGRTMLGVALTLYYLRTEAEAKKLP